MTQQQAPDFGNLKVVRNGITTVSTIMPAPVVVSNEPVNAIMSPQQAKLKKPWLARFWWLPLLVVIGIAGVSWGRNYYEARYVGSDYWAQIPATQDVTPVERRTMSGDLSGDFGVDYEVRAFNEAGESRVLTFTARGRTAETLPQPGDYVWISASRTLVVRQRRVPQSEVPVNVLEMIAAHHN